MKATSGGVLKGMAWDHPRARNPLEAISDRWSAEHDMEVSWVARPLKDFEDQPLEELATQYDLVLIDHPFVGTAATSGLVLPVDDWVSTEYLADQASHSAGPSFSSYSWAGKQWALAIDAACQVGAVRDDLLGTESQAVLPADWSGVVELAASQKPGLPRVAIPLNPNHAYCVFLSLGVSLVGPDFWRQGEAIDRAAAIEALEFLQHLAGMVHPMSRNSDPITVSDRMAESDEIAYVPLMFGYSSYARQGFRKKRLRFSDAPKGESGCIGSVLGGVGLALSSQSSQQKAAADLARFIAAPATQCGLYTEAGGQAGHSSAWESQTANELMNDFFLATRKTIDQSFIRPRIPGHRLFQVEVGELIHQFIWSHDLGIESCLGALNERVEKLLWKGDA